jgi:hypothetical protein
MTREERLTRVEKTIGAVARMVVSLMVPLWGLMILILGVNHHSLWWIGCGAVVFGVGAILLVANPLVWPLVRDLEYDR